MIMLKYRKIYLVRSLGDFSPWKADSEALGPVERWYTMEKTESEMKPLSCAGQEAKGETGKGWCTKGSFKCTAPVPYAATRLPPKALPHYSCATGWRHGHLWDIKDPIITHILLFFTIFYHLFKVLGAHNHFTPKFHKNVKL